MRKRDVKAEDFVPIREWLKEEMEHLGRAAEATRDPAERKRLLDQRGAYEHLFLGVNDNQWGRERQRLMIASALKEIFARSDWRAHLPYMITPLIGTINSFEEPPDKERR